MANKWIQRTVEIPKDYSEDERTAIGLEIIRYIRERTLDGKGPGNKKWSGAAGKYSESYINSLNFRIGRKSKGNVNLKLEGDMLEAMTLISQRKGKIKFGYDEGSDQAGKVEGNVRGTYGNASPISGKARDFLEITEKELSTILAKYPINNEEKRQERTDTILTSKLAKDILDTGDGEA